MIKFISLTALLLICSNAVNAQTYGSIDVNGSAFELSQFEMKDTAVAIASDKKGRKFNVVKLPNGKMMALVSMEKVGQFSPFADDSEMMYSGHSGTAR